ncbi:glycogen debranching protein GlgX [Actinotignum urinale]|uniref:glycogen debranching protein GlgX n=1 Tax=Actinotignum urinale TaxID=190146 RepID=UPI001FED05FA|nr:glycogen debranching protein GlgX [Actinotignum urinale]WIK59371.1 glycogen debranching protein GlgX [Actinotignum urinale]
MSTLSRFPNTSARYVARAPERTQEAVSRPLRLGAHLVEGGADFAVLAPHATAVELCLIDKSGPSLQERRFKLHPHNGTWSAFIPGVRAGQEYGYRVHGLWDPDQGMRFNPAKFLLDPYARAVTGSPELTPELYAHHVNEALSPTQNPPVRENLDSLKYMCRGVVVPQTPPTTKQLFTPWEKTVIYETHVKGFTQQLELIPEPLRGTYSGLAHPVSTDYLRSLGVTTIELLPIYAKMSEPFLTQRDLSNYWGYSTLSYFAPEPSYATQIAQMNGPLAVIQEVKDMVARLHEAGLEVILDVVYNHSCEGGVDGPTISWRGFGQTSYYMQQPNYAGGFYDTTGCGNSFDFRRQAVLKMTLDSMRYWVTDIGVDGFRFDLSSTLARKGDQFDPNHPLFMAMATDPVLSNVKLINEPWDMGPNGWQTGNFPPPTADWNDRFRDSIRQFWVADQGAIANGHPGTDLRDLATCIAGSADLFSHGRASGGRGPLASINFVTAHDGFSLRDLVSYNGKHNEANKEDNRDGTDNNRSWNHGVEGDEGGAMTGSLLERRTRTMRNLLGTLLFSSGVPMIYGGDEMGDTKFGNNNSYCQDSEISWLNWDVEPWQQDLAETTAFLIRLRQDHRVLRPSSFYTETVDDSKDQLPDLMWYGNDGNPMPDYRWFDPTNRCVQVLRSGAEQDADALVIINGSDQYVPVRLPESRGTPYALTWDSTWRRPIIDSTRVYEPGASTVVDPMSIRLFFANPEP